MIHSVGVTATPRHCCENQVFCKHIDFNQMMFNEHARRFKKFLLEIAYGMLRLIVINEEKFTKIVISREISFEWFD